MSHSLFHLLVDVEPLLNLLAVVVCVVTGVSKRFPAMFRYLGFRLGSCVVLEAVLNLHRYMRVSQYLNYQLYAYSYWITYCICAVLLFLVIQEIFYRLMEPIPSLRRLSLTVFRWVCIISVIVSLGTIRVFGGIPFLQLLCPELMHTISIMELCLLAFLALAIHALGRSYQSMAFGIALGLGAQATAEMLNFWFLRNGPLWSNANFLMQIVTTVVFLGWTAYFLVPEPASEKSPVVLPADSPLLRWNEVAKALGHSTPQVAVAPSGFFLQDVERVVDKVMAKNALHTAK